MARIVKNNNPSNLKIGLSKNREVKKVSKAAPREASALSSNPGWDLKAAAYLAFPGKEEWRERLIHAMYAWAEKEESLVMSDFTCQMRIAYMTFSDWLDKYPDIKNAWIQAKYIVGNRLKRGILTKTFDKEVVFKDLHKYDPEWHEINVYQANLKVEHDRQPTTFIINTAKPDITSREELREIVDKTL